jgi:chaperone BCS1
MRKSLYSSFPHSIILLSNGLTFSGFLNALDGVVSSEGRIIFMTTNHLERLDPALLRPGRVDVRALIDNASPSQIRRMFLRFYEQEVELADRFVRALAGHSVSTAQLQGHFLFHKHSAQSALEHVDSLMVTASTSNIDCNVVDVSPQKVAIKEE